MKLVAVVNRAIYTLTKEKEMNEQTESILTTLDRYSGINDMLTEKVEAAEVIMLDAYKHLSRKQMGQDNNELAARMIAWVEDWSGEQ
jgi:thymidylate kinase